MKHLTRIATLMLAAVAVSAYAQDPVVIKRSSKVGDMASYKMEATIAMEGLGEGTFSSTSTQKVTKVADNGEVTTEIKTQAKAVFGGQEIPIPETTQTEVRDPFGDLKEFTGGNEASPKAQVFRMDALQRVHLPEKGIKVGDTWTVESKADEKNDKTAAKVEYKLEAAEDVAGHKTFKISSKGKESSPGETTSDITFWIDTTSGIVIKADGSLKHAEVGAPAPVDMKFKITLVESK